MGFFSNLISFLESFSDDSYYIEDSISWFNEAWKRVRRASSAEGRLIKIGNRIYRQLYVELEDDMTALLTDNKDYGCESTSLNLSKAQKEELNEFGRIIIKRFKE